MTSEDQNEDEDVNNEDEDEYMNQEDDVYKDYMRVQWRLVRERWV